LARGHFHLWPGQILADAGSVLLLLFATGPSQALKSESGKVRRLLRVRIGRRSKMLPVDDATGSTRRRWREASLV
jgi:hypothetical protein